MCKYTVLVVDDEKEIIDAIEIYLQNEDIRILKAYDGLEALEILEEEDLEKIKVGDLELDKRSKSFQVNGENVKITPIEYKILELLMSNAGRVYSAEAIYESAWGEPCFSTDTVMVHIRRIREKIEIDSKNPRYLKVVWGIGYKIDTN